MLLFDWFTCLKKVVSNWEFVCVLAPPTLNFAEGSFTEHRLAQMADIDVSRRNKKPRPLREEERQKLEEFIESIHYSAR